MTGGDGLTTKTVSVLEYNPKQTTTEWRSNGHKVKQYIFQWEDEILFYYAKYAHLSIQQQKDFNNT